MCASWSKVVSTDGGQAQTGAFTQDLEEDRVGKNKVNELFLGWWVDVVEAYCRIDFRLLTARTFGLTWSDSKCPPPFPHTFDFTWACEERYTMVSWVNRVLKLA